MAIGYTRFLTGSGSNRWKVRRQSGRGLPSRHPSGHASKSHVHALGLAWDDVTGRNNGQ